jgi:hypothetical protein
MGYLDDADDHTKPLLASAFIFLVLNILINRLIIIRYYSNKEFIGVSVVTVAVWVGLQYIAYH